MAQRLLKGNVRVSTPSGSLSGHGKAYKGNGKIRKLLGWQVERGDNRN